MLFKSDNEFETKAKQYCLLMSEKYNISAEILERIAYFTAEDKIYELMPVMFELMAKNTDKNILELFQPMVDFFEETVMPIIEDQKKLHVQHYCAPLLDQINEQSIAQNDVNYSGRCITDFIDL